MHKSRGNNGNERNRKNKQTTERVELSIIGLKRIKDTETIKRN